MDGFVPLDDTTDTDGVVAFRSATTALAGTAIKTAAFGELKCKLDQVVVIPYCLKFLGRFSWH